MAGLSKLSLNIAIVLFLAFVIFRLVGFHDINPVPLLGGVRPSSIHDLADTFVMFAIAFGVLHLAGICKGSNVLKVEPVEAEETE